MQKSNVRIANLYTLQEGEIQKVRNELELTESTLKERYPNGLIETEAAQTNMYWVEPKKHKAIVNSEIIRSSTDDMLYTGKGENQLLNAVLYAYNTHGGLRLSPDMILQCVAMAVSNCVNSNAEEYREILVKHTASKKLTVHGDSTFNLESLVSSMSAEIDKNILIWDYLKPSFTTTTATTQTVAAMTKMATFKKYFSYEMRCCCGINAVELSGSLEDWFLLKDKVEKVRDVIVQKKHMVNWFNHMLKVIDYLIETYEAADSETRPLWKFAKLNISVDLELFWSRIITYVPYGSGGQQYVSGWFKVLIPGDNYDDFPEKLNLLDASSKIPVHDVCSDDVYEWQDKLEKWAGLTFKEPKGCAFVEIKLDLNGTKYDLYNMAGFVGFRIDADTFVTPELGYTVHWVLENQGVFENGITPYASETELMKLRFIAALELEKKKRDEENEDARYLKEVEEQEAALLQMAGKLDNAGNPATLTESMPPATLDTQETQETLPSQKDVEKERLRDEAALLISRSVTLVLEAIEARRVQDNNSTAQAKLSYPAVIDYEDLRTIIKKEVKDSIAEVIEEHKSRLTQKDRCIIC